MKIALVRARYNPSGGAERFAERALIALADQDALVSVIARSWKPEGAAPIRCALVTCDPFYLGSVWRDWGFARAVVRLVRGMHFDLVQSHERIPGLAIYRAGDGVHASWLARRRAALGLRARLGVLFNPHHWYLVRVERLLFEHPELRAVICNSSLVAREIAERFQIDPAKLHRIPNGVDLERFHPRVGALHRVRTRALLDIGADAPVLLFMGSGFERKGLAYALDALARLPAAVHLVVVGDDKRRARYTAQARRLGLTARVHFVGEQADPLPFLAGADALVLPTLYDPFPNAVLEALACGLPVITSDACGALDVVQAGTNGWIHRSADSADLTEKLRLWLDRWQEPGGRAALGESARLSVAGHGTEALGAALMALYRGLLGAPESAGAGAGVPGDARIGASAAPAAPSPRR